MDEAAAEERDIRASQPTGLVKFAAAMQAIGGLLVALTGLQALLSVRVGGLVQLAPWAMIVGGVASVALGVMVGRARAWAATAGAVVGTLLALGTSAWVVASLLWGIYSCLAIVAVPFAVGAAVLGLVAIGPCRRATEARRRLQQSGFDFGV